MALQEDPAPDVLAEPRMIRPLATSDPSGYHHRQANGNTLSPEQSLPELCPKPPDQVAFVVQEAAVSEFGGQGRPRKDDAATRKARFLCAIADGNDAVQAAKDAKLDPWRALRIVTEADFNDVVRAIRAGVIEHAAVVVEPQPDTLAA